MIVHPSEARENPAFQRAVRLRRLRKFFSRLIAAESAETMPRDDHQMQNDQYEAMAKTPGGNRPIPRDAPSDAALRRRADRWLRDMARPVRRHGNHRFGCLRDEVIELAMVRFNLRHRRSHLPHRRSLQEAPSAQPPDLDVVTALAGIDVVTALTGIDDAGAVQSECGLRVGPICAEFVGAARFPTGRTGLYQGGFGEAPLCGWPRRLDRRSRRSRGADASKRTPPAIS
jgi:hypothetical protein